MKIVEICDPVFNYICYINRCAGKSIKLSYNEVSEELSAILRDINGKLGYGTDLWRQYSRIEKGLKFFIDSMICESGVSCAREWDKNRLAYEVGEMTGDLKFFKGIDELLEEFSLDAEECLKFYYYCIMIGFTGIYKNDPTKIKYYLDRIINRIPSLETPPKTRLGSMISANVDSRNLIQGKTWLTCKKVIFIILLLIGISALLNIFFYNLAVDRMFGIFNKLRVSSYKTYYK